MQSVGERLRVARLMADALSTRELSALAGLSVSHVHQIESGAKGNPESETAKALARVLGVTLDWLLSGEGKVPSARAVRAAVEAARSRSSPSAA